MPKAFHLDTSSKILKITEGGKLIACVNIVNLQGVTLARGRKTTSIAFSGVGTFAVNAADTYAEDREEPETATAANILTAVLASLNTGERTISERSAAPEAKPEVKDESKAKTKTKAKEEPKEEVKEEANPNVSTEAPVL